MSEQMQNIVAIERELVDAFKQAGTPHWLVKMREYYAKTGAFRHDDLRRLLGSPVGRVEIGPKESFSALLGEK